VIPPAGWNLTIPDRIQGSYWHVASRASIIDPHDAGYWSRPIARSAADRTDRSTQCMQAFATILVVLRPCRRSNSYLSWVAARADLSSRNGIATIEIDQHRFRAVEKR
jgi:hypothetical protein